MTATLEIVSAAIAAGAVLVGGATAVSIGVRAGLSVLLDLLLAAGLLRLTADPGWGVLATTALVVAIRHLVTAGLSARPHPTTAPAQQT
ncbi:hypothetical protein GCM10023169_29240 [Georgenia halophila]|uniref:DUF1622 domain-containing protein n=1 Tax=Georgenia halophila TaxID=620889 RepID=A0ABP8LH68_9MICO